MDVQILKRQQSLMKVLYHIPSLDSIYANRTIYHGFRNAFLDMGHEFRPFTAEDNLKAVIEDFRPDLFVTSSHYYYRKFIDYELLKSFRREGLFTLTKIDFWDSPISGLRINEAKSLKNDKVILSLLDSGALGDAFFHVVEQNDPRMHGFKEATGHDYYTIPLAADKTILKGIPDTRFDADVSYIGTALPEKRDFFRENVFPLGNDFNLKIYGQDWTTFDRALGWVQRAGQFFNYKPLAKIRKPKLALEDEAKIYASSVVSINIHEKYQIKFGGDCNERTFKIPFCNGFEVVDDVACIRKYFLPGVEIAIAENSAQWVEMVRHYIKHPDERTAIIDAGRSRVLKDHTYHNRAEKMIEIVRRGNKQ